MKRNPPGHLSYQTKKDILIKFFGFYSIGLACSKTLVLLKISAALLRLTSSQSIWFQICYKKEFESRVSGCYAEFLIVLVIMIKVLFGLVLMALVKMI